MTDDPINRIVYLLAGGNVTAAENKIVELAMVHGHEFTMDDADRILAAAQSQVPEWYEAILGALRDNSQLTIH